VRRLSPLIRISLGLVAVTGSILVLLDLFGMLNAPDQEMRNSRVHLCEVVAAAIPGVERDDFGAVQKALQSAVARSDDVLSAGLRRADGRLQVSAGRHHQHWGSEEQSARLRVSVPIYAQGRGGAAELWGSVEMRFAEPYFWNRPLVRTLILLSICGFAAYLLFMRRTLRHLDPSAVVPARVQTALDVMVEGVVLIDTRGRILLANAEFSEKVGRDPDSLLGVDISTLGWSPPAGSDPNRDAPWIEAMQDRRSSEGVPLLFETAEGEELSFMVNGGPILDTEGIAKGAVVTFDDVTELHRTLALLESSRDEIQTQNEELQLLARRDPLTDVANRRAFFGTYEAMFSQAKADETPFSLIMADIDHFKLVNDNHGHQVGDRVIQSVADVMKSMLRSSDAVCRYGGEEFCVVLAETPIDGAELVAERLRGRIEVPGFTEVPVTVSLGVSSIEFGAETFADLIEQADQSLYSSKEAGRNRVTRWDQRPEAPDAAGNPGSSTSTG